jgi:hypothetical protein
MISFLWSTYTSKWGPNRLPAGIASSEAEAERRVRRAFETDPVITGADIWEVKLTASADGRLFEWRPVRRSGLIFTRDDKRAVITLPR